MVKQLLLILISLLVVQSTGCQPPVRRGDIRMVFYNTENYFDTVDDTLTRDEEFLPEGSKEWNVYRFNKKRQQIFQVMAAIGTTEAPEIIALVEIENRFVLDELARNTPLSKYPYQVVHFDSPDLRGIDVGMLFRGDVLELIHAENIAILFPDNPYKHTRDILYVSLKTATADTLHCYINHWPSRRGGKAKSEPNRMYVAQTLKAHIEALQQTHSNPQIIICGDFNDEPYDNSLTTGLAAQTSLDKINSASLYNLSAPLQDSCSCGTYRYRAHWNMLDQFIVSGALLNTTQKTHTCPDCIHIGQFHFLLHDDPKYGGKKPYRTYLGPVYKGGFSDHLPIYMDLYFEE